MNNIDENYPYIVKEVMKHITEIKKHDDKIALLDIISDFCFKNKLEPELVGDAISSDAYFKSFIEKDCETHRIIINNKIKNIEEW